MTFKLNNMRIALGIALRFYTIVAKELKLKFKNFWRLILTFVEVAGEKLVDGGQGGFLGPPILNKVKVSDFQR